MEKVCRKCASKISPRPFFNFGKSAKTKDCMQEILLKVRYFGRGLSKILKKFNFIF